MADLYKLRDLVLALDRSDRENLKSLLDLEEQRNPKPPTQQEVAVWEALCAASHYPSRSLEGFLRDKHNGMPRAEYSAAVDTLYSFIETTKSVRHPKQDQAALLELIFECLAKDIGRKQEVTPKTLLHALPRMRLAIDNCYPGYVEAGALHRLIRVAMMA